MLKLDIRGYFMHIDRERLLDIAVGTLERMRRHRVRKGAKERWEDRMDVDFVLWLTREIALLNPTEGCRMAGHREDWEGLDPAKTLRHAGEGRGLPIGNLTSQLFSNVYLNVLDQHMKRTLGCRHYGRYVDDAYVVSGDREWLLGLVPKVRAFLTDTLGLDLHMGKVRVLDAYRGVDFLGAYIRPHRTYVENRSLERTEQGVTNIDTRNTAHTYLALNSYLGVLSHYATYNIRRRLFLKERFLRLAAFDNDITTFNKPVLTQ